MANGDAEKIIVLKSSDGKEFEVAKSVARLMQMIHHAMEDNTTNDPIPIPNINAEVLTLVLEYCMKHSAVTKKAEDGAAFPIPANISADEELKTWDQNFIDVDTSTLYVLLMAANSLGINGLLDLAIGKVSDMMKGKTAEEIRRTFNIENDLNPEEEEQMRLENQWAYALSD